tara:strand:+ start:5467 stop:6339 length:873 start_codon:yes stop_codon:yes gene_type:complete
MTKIVALIIYKIIIFFDKVFYFVFKRNFFIWIKDYIQNDSYVKKKILGKEIIFFVPNHLTNWRVDNFFTKEPETIEWINKFSNKDEIIFWDIGANIGIYSLYAALKHKNIQVTSFEPSTSNLRVLTRNISINNLNNKISVFNNPLTNKPNKILTMKETNFIEGGAFNTFGEEINFEGKKIDSKMEYRIYGTSINYILEKNILNIPDYIKIDVDGIEHLILDGASNYLNNNKLKEILIEINENFEDQYRSIFKIMNENNFILKDKKRNESLIDKNNKTYNFIFEKVNKKGF